MQHEAIGGTPIVPINLVQRYQRAAHRCPHLSITLALLALAILSYGVLIPWLGFYWDDWPNAWFLHTFGPLGFPRAFAADRPVLGWVYVLTSSLIGESPLGWHAFAVVTRWATAVAFAALLLSVWPKRRDLAAEGGALFLAYPGFTLLPVAMIFSHFFLLLGLHLLSLRLSIRLARPNPSRKRTLIPALAFSAVSLFSLEYFIGLEIVRPFLVWQASLATQETSRQRLRRVLRLQAPFALLALLYVWWRVAVIQFPTYPPLLLETLRSYPLTGPASLLGRMLTELSLATLGAWGQVLVELPASMASLRPSTVVHIGIILASLSVAVLLRSASGPQSAVESSVPSARSLAGLAAVGLIGGGWPLWIIYLERPLKLHHITDRFTLMFLFGATLAFLALLEGLRRFPRFRRGVWSAAVALAVGSHFLISNFYRNEWQLQQSLYWQLLWRAPRVSPETLLITNDIPLSESDNSLTAPINWLYAPDHHSEDMPYMLYFLSVRLGRGLPGLEPGLAVEQPYRATRFEGSTSKVLVLIYSPPSCLQVLDEVLHDSMAGLPHGVSSAVPLSSLDLIQDAQAEILTPPPHIFGREPAHTWCYFFQRADLARQGRDWDGVVQIGDEAFGMGFEPNVASEWIPFVEGYAMAGRLGRAFELSRESLNRNRDVLRMLCRTWDRVAGQLADREGEIRQHMAELACARG